MKPGFRGTVEEHERFKNRLLEEVLGQDVNEKVQMEKVMMLLWSFRDDPTVVTFMARFVVKYSGTRSVFDGIEFYLPQLAHMIIHLEVEWDDAVLERFALVIAQQSVHFALQLNWILQGALEDYCPENVADGTPNPTYSSLFYTRCLTLKKNIERVVVYGKPRSQELQRLYEQGQITKEEMKILELADRRFNALQIADTDGFRPMGALDGEVVVLMPNLVSKEEQREGRKPPTGGGSGVWVTRYCILEKTVLDCYMVPNGCAATKGVSPAPSYDRSTLKLDRAMSLHGATVEAPTPNNHKIEIITPLYKFAIRCSSAEEAKLWHRRLQEEATGSALFSDSQDDAIKQDLSSRQLNRYEFFQSERDFVYSLTQVAEDLRMKDRAQRKVLAPKMMQELAIPPTVYLPLVKSTGLWRRVSHALAKETKVFNTKERCPVVMHFLTRRGEAIGGAKVDPNLDVAEYMHAHFEVNEEVPPMEAVAETVEEDDENAKCNSGVEHVSKKEQKTVEADKPKDPIQESTHGSISNVWEGEDENEEGEEGEPRIGTRVGNFLRGTMVTLPSRVAKRIPKLERGRSEKVHHSSGRSSRLNRNISVIDRQTKMQPLVPILEGSRSEKALEEFDNASVGDGSVVTVEQSSIVVKDTVILGTLQEGDIDIECIERAKKYVSGGKVWAEKSAEMLEEARKELGEDAEDCQLEISSCLAKSNDDLRQEVFMMQMIHYYKSVFAQAKLPIWLKTYTLLSTSSSTGLLEFLTDANSLDGLKKSEGYPKGGLRKYFEIVYGEPNSKSFKAAQTNFMQSLAGYALVSYLLGLKDRHNGNIMIDTRGHLIHIDFGFAMGMAPGNDFSFERAPFKLTKEYIDVMGGVNDECYKEFERLFVAGFEEARKNSQIALGLVEIMMFKSNYPCFSGKFANGKALLKFEKRLMLNEPEKNVKKKALGLIRKSRQHFGTYLYDVFQNATNGYAI